MYLFIFLMGSSSPQDFFDTNNNKAYQETTASNKAISFRPWHGIAINLIAGSVFGFSIAIYYIRRRFFSNSNQDLSLEEVSISRENNQTK